MKRLFDLSMASVLAVFLALPLLCMALIVGFTSTGPSLYWSDRVGRHNQIFKMPKFRSMRIDTPAVAIRRSFLLSQRGYSGEFYSEDTDLWLRAVRAGASMRNISIPLLRYRVHSAQSISSGGGYAEVAGHWLREFLLSQGWYEFKGLVIALVKALFRQRLPRVKRYSKPV